MIITRQAFIKWTLITTFCGAHSFFWGYVSKANTLAMIAGMVTLIVMFSMIESHPRYQAKRAASPTLARALKYGLRLRLLLAGWVILVYPVQAFIQEKVMAMNIVMLPYMGEIFVGLAGIEATKRLTGIDITVMGNLMRTPATPGETAATVNMFDHAAATYMTTVITGLLHAIILAAICGVMYGILRLLSGRKQMDQGNTG